MQEQDLEHSDVKDARNAKAISEETIMALQNIFARLFSKDGSEIANYFKDLINSAQEILVEDILTAPPILELSSDLEVIRHAILTSKFFTVVNEGTAVKAYVKPEQNTIILRDIPSSVTIEAIYSIFASAVGADGTPCPPVVSARSDMNDHWFVTFASEDEAKLALLSIRESKIDNKIIKARLKTESSTKSFYSDKRNNFQNSPPSHPPLEFSQSPVVGNNVPNFSGGVGPIPFPTNVPAGVANLVTMGPSGGMFLAGYPLPPPSFMPNFGMQGGAVPMMGFPPPIMIPNPNGKPIFMNPVEAMQMQMMQMGGPQLPPQMGPHNPILFAPGPYPLPAQAAQGFVDVNAMQQGYRPQQVQPTGGRDFNPRPNVGNNMNSNINGSNNNRYPNSSNLSGSRNGSNYNNSNNNQNQQGGLRQQNNNRNPRGNAFNNHGGGGNYFYNRNNNYSGSSNNSGIGNSNDQSHGWQESGNPSAEFDGGSVGDNYTLNASMSSQSSGGEGRNNETKISISTEGISHNENRSPSNRSYGGDQGHRGAFDNNYSGGNTNNYNRNLQQYNQNYNGANRVSAGDVTNNMSNMAINRTDQESRNVAAGGRGNFRQGPTSNVGPNNASAYSSQRNKAGVSNNKPISSSDSQPTLGETTSKESGDITGSATTNGRNAAGSSTDTKPVRRSGSNVGISENDVAATEETHSNAPRGGALKSSGAAAGDSRGKGSAANIAAGKDGKDGKEKDKERPREREREKGDRSASKRGDKKDKKGGDSDKPKKVAAPIAEFNLEADFPNLVENDPEASHASSHVGPVRVAALGYANAVRKAVGSETTLPPTISDGGAPVDAAANSSAAASGPQKSGGGKGGNKASNKSGNTPAASAAPAQKAATVPTGEAPRELSFGNLTNSNSSNQPSVTAAAAAPEAAAADYLEPITFGAFSEPIQITNADSLHFGPVTTSAALAPDAKPTSSGDGEGGATNADAADASATGADHAQGGKATAGSETSSSTKSAAKKSFSEILRQQK